MRRALVPGYCGNRGFLERPLHRAREHTGVLLHKIVHIYAPNTHRFLAEGLAVYLHTQLAGNPAFPNFGEGLRRLAVRGLSGVESLDALHSVRTPRPLGTVMEEKTAYILAGSFVGFVIERYGLASFRSLYETGNDEQVYGRSLGTLEKERWDAQYATPRTLIHWDAQAANFLRPARAGAVGAVVDWQNCVIGRGIWDIARFCAMSLPPAARRAAQEDLVALYAETLVAHGVQVYPFPQCFAHYQAVLPLLFAQQLRFFAGVQCWDAARRAWVEVITPRVVAALHEAAEAGLVG